jgi:uncharacterized OB-fold protein
MKMAEEKADRPVPKPSVYIDTSPFWEGAKNGKLVLQFCKDTKQFQHYPRPVSIFTGSRNIEWREVSGKGSVYAVTTIRVPGPGLDGRLPLVVATVRLDEGVRILGNILDADPSEVTIDRRVELAWDPLSGDVKYPAFKLV